MIKAIRDLGFFELKEVSGKEIFDIEKFEEIREENPQLIAKLIAEKATARTGVKVYVLKIEDDELTYELDETVYKDNDCREDKYRDYLFKEPRSSKGSYISPTFKLSPPVSEKAIKRGEPSTSASRLYEYLKNAPDDLKEFKKFDAKEIDSVFQKIRKENKDNKSSILITIKPNGNCLASLSNLCKKFIDGFIEETKYLAQNAPKDYNPANQKGQCSICLRENLPLLGYFKPYNFFTVDKIGFYPSFKNYESWKYFPVCESCGILIQAGKNFLENHFRARMAGYNTLVIVKNKELVEKQKRFVDFNSMKSFKQIAYIERFLIKQLPELTNVESYNFMFYREKQNQFEILLLIPEVLPSRIKRIVDAIKEIKEKFEWSNWFDLDKVQKNKGNWRIDTDFYFIEESVGERVDFPKIEYSPTKVKVLNLFQSVFVGTPISFKEIISEISSKLQFVFRQSLNFDNAPVFKLAPYVFSGAATIEILKEVNVMETEVSKMAKNEDYPERLKEVFDKHKTFFDTPQKRACFLVGVLYGKLEALQASSLINKKGTSLGWLRSLDLRWDHLVKDLFPRIHLKFKEYDNATPVLGKEVKEVFRLTSSEIESCGAEGLEREEIPFYFTLGWTSYKTFLPPKAKEEEDVDEDKINSQEKED
ncbi:MAG: type I-B CRISPR-associated protein Cas8b/Csh1 [Thermodesulfobium narugense]|nr:MAG: type I-B CRISPR-associated protein Cas8b/Csh1 [Thermodesulfobium narugense]